MFNWIYTITDVSNGVESAYISSAERALADLKLFKKYIKED
jgi:hypothetical protein